MSDKLVKDNSIPWGEDLVHILKNGGELASVAEEKLYERFLLIIRKCLEVHPEARMTAAEAKPAIEAKDELYRIMDHEGMIREGTETIFTRALTEILIELEQLREANVGLVLVDATSGQAIMPMSEEMIYTPPDFIGEDGQLHKAQPILHPGISSSLAIMAQEKHNQIEILRKARDPKLKMAYAHITGPNNILKFVEERLARFNIQVVDDIDGVEAVGMEFGREQVDGVEQSFNPQFHRISMFAAVLASHILKNCGPNSLCSFGEMRLERNSRERWYKIQVKMKHHWSENHELLS